MTADNRLKLPDSPSAAGMARRFLVAHTELLPRDIVGDALLLVSELVSNAVRHGIPPAYVRLDVDTAVLRVAVHDCGPEVGVMDTDSTDGGRGLLIVAALATTWGITADVPPPGKAAWFELTIPPLAS